MQQNDRSLIHQCPFTAQSYSFWEIGKSPVKNLVIYQGIKVYIMNLSDKNFLSLYMQEFNVENWAHWCFMFIQRMIIIKMPRVFESLILYWYAAYYINL